MKQVYIPSVFFTVLQMGITTNQVHVISEQTSLEPNMCEINQCVSNTFDQLEEVDEVALPVIAESAEPTKPVVSAPVVTAPTDLDPLFEKYSGEFGVSSTTMKIIAKCESHFNPGAISSNGLYGGMYQYSASTWKSTRNSMGLDPNPELRFNAEEAIRTTAFKIASGGIGAWPVCGSRAVALK